jgi:homopolymeric O-antigen transport system ATP-binding protein
MSDIAIRVDGLGKQYHIGRRERYRTLRDTLTGAATALFRKARTLFHGPDREKEEAPSDLIWALKDVSFEVPRGSVVGVIGRNGAGKSTLLKVLSRITEPTEGRVEIHGRVGSLLEVGTGFHSELSGRENIFLNGAILGMKRAEIQRKFDDIVAFAEIDKFIDTPVKHYSSGMYMRLAFAVAAHLEPEILIVDEVLAVGDAEFQKKCLGKMGDVAKEGRTVLFVSHNLTVIRNIAPRSLLLQAGALVCDRDTDTVVARYQRHAMADASGAQSRGVIFQAPPEPLDKFRLLSVQILGPDDHPVEMISTWDHVKFRIRFHAPTHTSSVAVEFRVRTTDGVPVLRCSTRPHSNVMICAHPGSNTVDCEFPCWPLASGKHLIAIMLSIPMRECLTSPDDIAILETHATNVFHSTVTAPMAHDGLVATPHTWIVNPDIHAEPSELESLSNVVS